MELTFSALQLIVAESAPSLDDFQDTRGETYTFKENTYELDGEKIEERFYWLHVQHGRELPYSDLVIDKATGTKTKNSRTKSQAELNQQLFCLYDATTMELYISDIKKTPFLKDYLEGMMDNNVEIKRFFLTPEDFIKQIKSIDKISLTSKKNLFTTQSGLFVEASDIFGLGQPEDFKIDINYKGCQKTKLFGDFFSAFLDKKNNEEISSLVCIGKNDKGIEAAFDINSYTQKRRLHLTKDSNGLYDVNQVKNKLVNELTGTGLELF